MKTKQEVLSYLAKQINDKKAVIEYTRKQPYQDNNDIFIEDWKAEIETLLTAMTLILENE